MTISTIFLDAFGTLVLPRKPIYQQYASIARSYGLYVSDNDVKSAFKTAFRETARRYPLYGKADGLDPSDWWTLIIERTFDEAGIAGSDLQTTLPTLAPALLEQFSSSKGYMLAPDVLPFFSSLAELPNPPRIGIISNSDSRILSALEDLDVIPRYIQPKNIFTSWEVGVEKPDRGIFEAAMKRCCETNSARCLVVGDDYEEDVQGAQNAGMRAALLRRDNFEPLRPGAKAYDGKGDKVQVITSLEDINTIIQT